MNNSADASFNDNLIQAIQQYPNLWDKGSADYHDSDMNRNSWESISTTVEKNVDECKTRWRTLRDEFRKNNKVPKSGSGAKKRKFGYQESLSFLKVSSKRQKENQICQNLSQMSLYLVKACPQMKVQIQLLPCRSRVVRQASQLPQERAVKFPPKIHRPPLVLKQKSLQISQERVAKSRIL